MKSKVDIDILIKKLNEATEAYDKGQAIMSDQEWDNLYFELKEWENQTGIILNNSPTQKIHFEKVSELKKVKHNHPMLSLDKTKDIKEIESFCKEHDWIAMAKLDGLTCSLRYIDGKLISAETRGNGIEGEDITHNAKVISSIPQKINYKDELIVDGEVICTYSNFEQFKNEYKNPRNFASGSIRLLDSKECAHRNLTFIAWDIINGDQYLTLTDKLNFLNLLNFKTVPYLNSQSYSLNNAIPLIKDSCEGVLPIDGVVFKYDNIEEYNAAGRTDHHFKGGLAYKFYDEIYETEVKDIEWTMGRTGQLTPVLIYNDIEIDGAICNRASLHNISVMTQLMGGAYPGQRVFIYKANQVVPQVKSAQANNSKHIPCIEIPKICPYCGKPTEIRKDNDSEVLYCTNEQCESRLINRLEHFCSKSHGLDIKGLSKATFQKLIDWEWLKNLEDIFNLNQHRNEWINKPGFGVKSVDKILNSIEEHRHTTLNAFISAIGIPLIGQAVAKDLTKYFKTYKEFRKAVDNKDYYFYNLDNFGEEMNNSIKNFDYSEADKISKILIFEVPVVSNTNTKNNLSGKNIVITGKLTTFKNRNELKQLIESCGGKVIDNISTKVSFLINNDINSASSKNKKAKELNIPIISEQEFLEKYIKN